ncbi:MAG: diguanylate cyclase [Lachnospiraceae bacterium]|nr:diguanylate cyclase [Lachnospiraceae bacterium]
MNIDQKALSQVATTLARHFDSIYYIEIETGNYCEFMPAKLLKGLNIPKQGKDFFAFAGNNAPRVVHPDDLELVLKIHDKETILKILSENHTYTVGCRLIINGKIVHVRHINIMCEDKKHFLFCMENVDAEIKEAEKQKEDLRNAEHMARLDELTGVKNHNAFVEETRTINEKISSGVKMPDFAVVMCDINDLKRINDTRGHSFGDEAIQRTSHMICEIYKHSPVFRIGGDEFVVILTGSDFRRKEALIEKLKKESVANKRSRSGPYVACGMAVYDPGSDSEFSEVFERADALMYQNKKELKTGDAVEGFNQMETIDEPIPDERKRLLDAMFGALLTVSGGGYVYLNDMKYDYSRWALSLINDFGLKSEYMYHADSIWLDYVHPDDTEVYKDAVEAVLRGDAELRLIYYRAKNAKGEYVLLTTRGFVLSDKDGNPEYFGGIIIPQ